MTNKLKNIFKPKLKLVKGTRFISFCFIGLSVMIAAGILFAANMYYNIDTQEVVLEEIYRVAGVVRATAGLVVGGGTAQDPAPGYGFEVATSTLFSAGNVVMSAAGQELRFTGGQAGQYVGFRAPDGLSATSTYLWPGAYPAGSNYLLRSSDEGALSWADPGDMGLGTITAVGDVVSGRAFTQDTATGTSLWFHRGTESGKLTIAESLGENRTYTLPDLSGTVALQDGSLTAGGVLFAVDGLIDEDATNFFWHATNRYLRLGSASNAGELRIHADNASGYYLGFAATSSMTESTTYYWPTTYGTEDFVLTTDGSGNLIWSNVEGVGGVTGTGVANYLAKWTDASTLATSSIIDNYTGTALTIDGSGHLTVANNLTVSGTLIASLIQQTGGDLTLQTLTSGKIILQSADGIVELTEGTVIQTADGGPASRQKDEEVLREMIPVLGFEMPVRCGAVCETATTVSRTIESYSFSPPMDGTDRIHRFVIRYADSGTTASSTWTVWDETAGVSTSTFSVPASVSTDLGKGEAYVSSEVNIPINDNDWHLRVQVPEGVTIQIYQVFLAAYDRIK